MREETQKLCLRSGVTQAVLVAWEPGSLSLEVSVSLVFGDNCEAGPVFSVRTRVIKYNPIPTWERAATESCLQLWKSDIEQN